MIIIQSRLSSISNIILFISVSCYCLFTNETAQAYTILTPASENKLFIQARRPYSSLVIKVPGNEDSSSLRVEKAMNRNVDTELVKVDGKWAFQGNTYVHYTLTLKNGKNSYTVYPGGKEINIRYRPVRSLLNIDVDDPKAYLFHRSEVVPPECAHCHDQKLPDDAKLDVKRLQKNADFSPVCFSCHRQMIQKNLWQHSPSANVLCWTCHRQGEENTKITMLSGRVDENCFECHVNRQNFKNNYVHGPVGTGDCTVCHDPHGGEYKFELWADAKADLCVGCHLDKKNVLTKTIGYYSHGILQGRGCIVCHSPHADENRFQLYKPINDLCVSCHTFLQGVEKGHPVGNHPLKGKPDPLRKGRELACSSCHNPHGSNYRYILIGDVLGGHVCSKCHH